MRFQSLGGHLLFFLMSSFACFNMLKVSFELWPVLDSWLDKNKIEVNYDLKSVFFLWQKGQKIIISLVNLRLLKVLDELHNSLHLVQQRSTMGLSQSSLSEQLLPLRSDTFYNFFLKKLTLLHSPRSVIGQLWVRGLNFSLSSFFFFFFPATVCSSITVHVNIRVQQHYECLPGETESVLHVCYSHI